MITYNNKGENFARSLVTRPIDGIHVDLRGKTISNAGYWSYSWKNSATDYQNQNTSMNEQTQ